MDKHSTISLKILADANRKFASDRELRNKYETNHSLKFYGFYCVLKTFTQTGKIQDWFKQINEIKSLNQIKSTQIVKQYITGAGELGLIKVSGNDLILTSHKKVYESINTNPRKKPLYFTFNYNPNDEIKPETVLKLSTVIVCQHYRKIKINCSINQNILLKDFCNDQDTLKKIQLQSFVHGYKNLGMTKDEYRMIHSVNADEHLTQHALRKLFNYKSNQSIGDLKQTLMKVAEVSERKLNSNCLMRKNDNYYTGYDKEKKQSWWQLPDSITSKIQWNQA